MKSILIILLLASQAAASQQVGDTVQAFLMESIARRISSGKKDIFAGKYVVLDFWGSRCGTCIQSMPKIMDIQQKFKDDLVIIYVAREDSAEVAQFFKRRPTAEKFKLPFITSATDLAEKFPFKGIPHLIWIGPDLVIKAITGSSEFHAGNVAKLIKDGSIKLPVKEYPIGFDARLSLLNQEDISERHVLQASVLLESLKGLSSQISVHKLPESRFKILALQVPLRSMYASFYRYDIAIYPHELVLRILGTQEVSPYLMLDKRYSFESIQFAPEHVERRSIFKKAIQQLDNQLSFRSSLVDTILDCYLLESVNTEFHSNDSAYTRDDFDSIYFHRQPLSHVANFIASHYRTDKLVLVEDSANVRVSMKIPKQNKDFTKLSALLEEYGIVIKVGEAKVKIIYITKDST